MAEEQKGNETQLHFCPPNRHREYEALMDRVHGICSIHYATEEEQQQAVDEIIALSQIRGFYPQTTRFDLVAAALEQNAHLIVRTLIDLGFEMNYQETDGDEEGLEKLKEMLLSTLSEEEMKFSEDRSFDSLLVFLRDNAKEKRKQTGKYLYTEWLNESRQKKDDVPDICRGIVNNDREMVVSGIRKHEDPDAAFLSDGRNMLLFACEKLSSSTNGHNESCIIALLTGEKLSYEDVMASSNGSCFRQEVDPFCVSNKNNSVEEAIEKIKNATIRQRVKNIINKYIESPPIGDRYTIKDGFLRRLLIKHKQAIEQFNDNIEILEIHADGKTVKLSRNIDALQREMGILASLGTKEKERNSKVIGVDYMEVSAIRDNQTGTHIGCIVFDHDCVETLDQFLKKDNKIPFITRLHICNNIIDMVRHMHTNNIVLVDLNASKLVRRCRGDAEDWLLFGFDTAHDLGIISYLQNSTFDRKYAAPEVREGSEVTKEADYWSLALLIIRILSPTTDIHDFISTNLYEELYEEILFERLKTLQSKNFSQDLTEKLVSMLKVDHMDRLLLIEEIEIDLFRITNDHEKTIKLLEALGHDIENIQEVLKDTQSTVTNVLGEVTNLSKFVTEDLSERINSIVKSLVDIIPEDLSCIKESLARIEQIVQNTATKEDVEELKAELSSIKESIEEIQAAVNDMSGRMDNYNEETMDIIKEIRDNAPENPQQSCSDVSRVLEEVSSIKSAVKQVLDRQVGHANIIPDFNRFKEEMRKIVRDSQSNTLISVQSMIEGIRNEEQGDNGDVLAQTLEEMMAKLNKLEGQTESVYKRLKVGESFLTDITNKVYENQAMINELMTKEYEIPTIPIFLPHIAKKRSEKLNPFRMIWNRFHLFFICPVSRKVSTPEEVLEYKVAKGFVKKAAPFLVLGIITLKALLFMNGIPTPMFNIPNFSDNEEEVDDYLDIVADQFEKMSRNEDVPGLKYERVEGESESKGTSQKQREEEEEEDENFQHDAEAEKRLRQSYEVVKNFLREKVSDLTDYGKLTKYTGLERVQGGEGEHRMTTWVYPDDETKEQFREKGREAIRLDNVGDIMSLSHDYVVSRLYGDEGKEEEEEEEEKETAMESSLNEQGLLVLGQKNKGREESKAEDKKTFLKRMKKCLNRKKPKPSSPKAAKLTHVSYVLGDLEQQEEVLDRQEQEEVLDREEYIDRCRRISKLVDEDDTISDDDDALFDEYFSQLKEKKLKKLSDRDIQKLYKKINQLATRYGHGYN